MLIADLRNHSPLLFQIIVPAVDNSQLWAAAVGVSTRAILYGLESALKVSWQFRTTRTTSSAQEGSEP
jgi:hypothetical protein